MKKHYSALLSLPLLLVSGWNTAHAARTLSSSANVTLRERSEVASLRGKNEFGFSGAKAYNITAAAPLSVATTSLAIGTSGVYYSTALRATGGSSPYSWSVVSGSLPSGLTLGANGSLSGTPTAGGSYSFIVSVTDKSHPTQNVKAALSVNIVSAVATPLSLPDRKTFSGTAGKSFFGALSASGGTLAYQWAVLSGSLPSGLTLNPSTGSVSGTPTTSGKYTATIGVTDSGSPAQSRSTSLTISVAAPVTALTVTASALTSATVGKAYSSTLNAGGGTPSYTWSLQSGSLPPGLTLSSSTGTISGTPSTAGSYSANITVTDSASPAQSATTTAAITVSAPTTALSITTTALASGTVNQAYTASLAATGGTSPYTWSIASGSLPAGLTLAASTGVVSGTPTVSGSFAVTFAVNDSGSQTASAPISLTVGAAAAAATTAGTTWYVRPDGGTRYSSIMTNGQCDGKSDAAYPGTGTNQHCAFKDVRFLWQDGSYTTSSNNFPSYGWVGQGGDTYIIRGSLGTGVTYRVGWNNQASAFDSTDNLYWGIQGDPYSSGAPLPPSGTASQHTRILGENYAACHAASAKTQLHGGYGVYTVLNLSGTSYVDVACLDITDFSSCGSASQANVCNKTIGSLSDFATFGIMWSNQSTNDTVADVHIHGMAMAGMFGPTGDGVKMDYIDLLGNASSGWNADPGNGTTGTGKLLVTHFNISWNGCAEEYPMVDALPYSDCTDDSSGGYGDGFGTTTVPSNPGWQATFDQGVASYNTQDGLDALHLTGTGSSMTITRVLAYGNMGQQIKVGGTSGIARNNVIVTNCNALRQAIPGTPAGYNTKLSDFCRAADSGVKLEVQPNSTVTFDFNTVYSASATAVEIDCDVTMTCDSTSKVDFRNNVFVGFLNSNANGYPATWPVTNNYSNPIYNGAVSTLFTNPGSLYSNNVTYHPKSYWTCPAVGESNAVCGDPQLADETWHNYGYGNVAPASASSIVEGSGVSLPSVTTDYTGTTRALPPSIGAYN